MLRPNQEDLHINPTSRSIQNFLVRFILVFCLLPIHGFAQEAQKIEIRRVVIDLELGKIIGSFAKTKIGQEIQLESKFIIQYGSKFERQSDFYEETLKDYISKSFKNKGILVQGYDNLYAELRENSPARYAFGFVLRDMRFNYGTNLNAQFNQFHSFMEFDVTVLDLYTKMAVYNKAFNVTNYSEVLGFNVIEGDFSNYFAIAFGNFVDDMLANPDIKAIIYQEEKTEQLNFESAIKLQTSTAPEKTLIQSALESTVTIRVGSGHGSGAIISPEGLILTCHHNINAAEEVEVVFSNGVSARASVVRKDPEYDIALLQLTDVKARQLYLSDRASVEVGEDAWVIGTPGFAELGQSVSRGVISGKRIIQEKEYLQTDASVNPGNSGGPLLDAKGRIVGIVNAKVIASGMEGLGFAIPVWTIVERLKIEME